jgi:hypothetical protein
MQSTEPVRRGSVSAEIHAPGVSREQLSSKIDPNGYYRIEGVPGGVDVTLMAVDRTADQPQMRRARIRTDANTVHRVDFDFGMANRVSGRIEGMPEGFSSTVFVLSADAGTERTLDGDALEALIECCFVAISPDNPQGAFEFENLGAGHYPVLIYVIDPDHPVDMPTAIESGHLVFDEMTVVEGGPNEITLQFE